jgi:hypothetical protein
MRRICDILLGIPYQIKSSLVATASSPVGKREDDSCRKGRHSLLSKRSIFFSFLFFFKYGQEMKEENGTSSHGDPLIPTMGIVDHIDHIVQDGTEKGKGAHERLC